MPNGNVDQLNFEVLIIDKRFNSQIAALNKTADQMNTKLSSVLEHLGKKGSKGFNDITNSVKATNTQLINTQSLMRTVAQLTGVAFSAVGIRRFLSTLVDVTGQFEVQRMALRNMLQDADAADKIFKDLYDFSTQSTYRFSELAKYSKQLAAFNIGKDNLLETTKMLGDVASGVGVSMDRLILAYGHVKSSGFLRGIQLRSFSQNGVPILQELSKMFTEIEGKAVSLGDVFDKMTKREIPFEMVEEAFKRMTSEGGKFYQMQEVLAKTLTGQINILKGKWENMMYAVGHSEEGFLKGTVQALTWIVDHMEAIANALKPVIIGLGAYGAALVTVAAAQGAMRLATFAAEFVTLAKSCGLASAAVLTFGSAAKAAAVGLGIAVTVIAGVAMAAKSAGGEMEKFRKRLDEIHEEARRGNAYDREISSLDRLQGILNNTNLGYSTRKDALDKIKRIVPGYLADLTEEGKLVNNNTTAIEKYVEALKRRAMMRGAEDELVELYNMRRASVRELDAAKEAKAIADATPNYIGGSSVTGAAISYIGDSAARVAQNVATSEAKIAEVDERIARVMKEIGEASSEGSESTNDMVYNVTSIVDGIKNIDAKLSELREKAKGKGITVDEKETLDQLKKDREDQTKLYKELMGVDYDKATRAGDTATAKALRDRVSGLKAEIQILEKYKDAYDKLQPYFGDETQSQMEKIFGAGDYTAIDSQIDALVADLRKLGKAGDEAADAIEARLGTDAVSKVLKAQKALETQQKKVDKWQNTLRKWEKDWGGNYSGFNSDLDNIVRGYNDESKKIDDEYADALKEIKEAHEGNAEAIWEETQKLKKLYEARKSSALNEAQNKLNESAKKYVKDATSGMSLTDWGDKSIGQVYRIWRDLSRMADESSIENVDGQLKQRVYKAGLLFKDFRKLTKEEFDKLSKEAQEELLKKAGQSIKEFASLFGDLAGQITEFANASGNEGLARVASDLSDAVSVASDAIAKALEGDYVGAILAEVTSVANEFFKAATAAAELKRTIRETAEEARRQRFTENLTAGVSNIFGTNDMASLRNAMNNINSLRSLTASDRRNAAGEFQTKSGAKWYDWFSKGANIFSIASALAKGRSQYDSISGMASKLGMDLFDEYNNLNANTLQAILDTYSDLRQADKEWIQQAINNSEAYAEAMRQVDDVISSIFDNVAQSATDAIVNGWISAGNAALNYADILDDVAQSYAKMVVKSMIMDEVLNDEAVKAVKDAFVGGDSAEAMSLIEGDLQRIADLEPVFQQVLETFDPYFSRESGSSDNTIKSGISKELVEKNSSLLASYINAMRADLSVMRQMQTSGWQDVKLIRESMQAQGTPNYNEYMAQVAANTYDMARSNEEILARLKSVITASPSGGSAVRTAK